MPGYYGLHHGATEAQVARMERDESAIEALIDSAPEDIEDMAYAYHETEGSPVLYAIKGDLGEMVAQHQGHPMQAVYAARLDHLQHLCRDYPAPLAEIIRRCEARLTPTTTEDSPLPF